MSYLNEAESQVADAEAETQDSLGPSIKGQ